MHSSHHAVVLSLLLSSLFHKGISLPSSVLLSSTSLFHLAFFLSSCCHACLTSSTSRSWSGQRFTMAQFLHRKDKHCHSLSCPHSVIHGKHLFCSHQLKLDYCCESHNALQFDTAFHVTASQSSSETTVPDLATIHNTANLCSCALVLNERLQP